MQCVTDLWQISRGCRFFDCPRKTHQALLLTFPRAPRSYLTRSFSTGPMTIPPITRNSVFLVTRSECVKLSDSHSFRQPDRRLPGFLDPDPDLTQQLALECRRWSCASETSLLSTCENEPKERRKYLGRASDLRLSFSSNRKSSASLQRRSILWNKNVDFCPACPLAWDSCRLSLNVENGSDSELRLSGI